MHFVQPYTLPAATIGVIRPPQIVDVTLEGESRDLRVKRSGFPRHQAPPEALAKRQMSLAQ